MKVLYLLNHAGKAGTERYVETLVRYLSADGRVEPYFAYNEPGLLVERMQAMSVPCRQIEMRSPYDLPAAKVLANLCREWGIELIHTHYLRENYIAMLAKGRNKAIRSVYTNHFVLANSSLNRLSNRLMDRRPGPDDRCVQPGPGAVGEKRLEPGQDFRHLQRCGPGRLGRGPERFHPPPGTGHPRGPLCDAVRLPVCPRQGPRLSHALSQAADGVVRHSLYHGAGGDGELLEPTKALARELGLTDEQVKFIGFCKDMKNLYKGADLYVNSSQHEALSFLIVEAMAAGLPPSSPTWGATATSSRLRLTAACW